MLYIGDKVYLLDDDEIINEFWYRGEDTELEKVYGIVVDKTIDVLHNEPQYKIAWLNEDTHEEVMVYHVAWFKEYAFTKDRQTYLDLVVASRDAYEEEKEDEDYLESLDNLSQD